MATYDSLSTPQPGFDLQTLINFIVTGTTNVKNQLTTIQSQGDNVSIGDMFNMQLLMNRLAQVSEMTTSVVNAANGAINSMARNVKG